MGGSRGVRGSGPLLKNPGSAPAMVTHHTYRRVTWQPSVCFLHGPHQQTAFMEEEYPALPAVVNSSVMPGSPGATRSLADRGGGGCSLLGVEVSTRARYTDTALLKGVPGHHMAVVTTTRLLGFQLSNLYVYHKVLPNLFKHSLSGRF